jgi:hypothetical protein
MMRTMIIKMMMMMMMMIIIIIIILYISRGLQQKQGKTQRYLRIENVNKYQKY